MRKKGNVRNVGCLVQNVASAATIAEVELPNAQVGLPMTYMHEDRQYIVLSVGGGGEPAELIALALPRDE